jgi:hypothetical protein
MRGSLAIKPNADKHNGKGLVMKIREWRIHSDADWVVYRLAPNRSLSE